MLVENFFTVKLIIKRDYCYNIFLSTNGFIIELVHQNSPQIFLHK